MKFIILSISAECCAARAVMEQLQSEPQAVQVFTWFYCPGKGSTTACAKTSHFC